VLSAWERSSLSLSVKRFLKKSKSFFFIIFALYLKLQEHPEQNNTLKLNKM
jgi:hypothetical protein